MDDQHPALRRLAARHPKRIDLSLGRILDALERLGRPQDRLPPVIHVAGTNGKGSLCAYLAAAHRAAGRRVHVYSSPHLVAFNERVVLADHPIDDATLEAALTEVDQRLGDAPITYFEATTAAAFLAFAQTPADLLVLETGLGGRLDATNIVDRPILTAITPIALDHMDFLGPSLAGIAAEKAGILKPGVPCVAARQPSAAASVLSERAAALGAPLLLQGRDWDWRPAADGGLIACGRDWRGVAPTPALIGDHQRDNAANALACLAATQALLPVSAAAAAAGIAGAVWPARLQRLTAGPLVTQATAAGATLWLDGGHNPHAGQALATALAADPAPLGVILGMLETKDAAGFIRPLARLAQSWRTVAIPESEAGRDPAALAELAAAAGARDVAPAAALSEALAALLAQGARRVLIGGSLYLAGAVLAQHR